MVSKPVATGPDLPPEIEDPNIHYPDTDGEPLAETDFQFNPLTEMVHALRVHYEDRPDVYAAGDMFVYYRMNDPGAVVAPDVYVVFGVDKHPRRSYFLWRDGKAPDFVMEIASAGSYHRDVGHKRDVYAAIGVKEYWRFDPLRECFDPPLAGERLVNHAYHPIPVGADANGILRGYSPILGLDLCVRDDLLKLYDPINRRWLLNLSESEAARAAAETARASAEAAHAAASQRNRELEALLRQHGISPNPQ